MTVFIKSNLQYINISNLDEDIIKELLNDTVVINSNKSFYNSVTIRYKENSKGRAIKIFRNGNLHITGFNKLEEAESIGKKTLDMFDEKARIEEVKIQMMNSCFRMETEFNLLELYEEFKQTPHLVKYDRERHAGLQIKIGFNNRWITVIVFRTGNILITGVKSMEELEYGYQEILRLLQPKIEDDGEPVSKRQKIDKAFDYKMFL